MIGRSLLLLGAMLVVSGTVFVGQGLGILRSNSFMVDDLRWSGIGAALVAVGLGLVYSVRRRRRTGRPSGE